MVTNIVLFYTIQNGKLNIMAEYYLVPARKLLIFNVFVKKASKTRLSKF